MLVAVLGLVIGVVLGFFLPNFYPVQYSFYISIAVLAALDSVFGAVRANMEGRFDILIFISGFLGNAIIAGLLAYIGDKMGVPLYYAAIFVFGGRLFQNFAVIRRMLIDRYFRKK